MNDTLGIALGPTLATLAVYVWTAASLHAVFRKAGEEGWQAWVPILNIVVLLRLGGFSGWWALLLLVPIAGTAVLAVVVWIACWRINASFGVGVGMTVLAVLIFPVWSSILGWGSARWLGREQVPTPEPQRTGTSGEFAIRSPAPAYGVPAASPPPNGAWLGERSGLPMWDAAPHTGTVPTSAAFTPPGPRRAMRSEPSDVIDGHAFDTHDVPVLPVSPVSPVSQVSPGAVANDPWAPVSGELAARSPRYSPEPGDGSFIDTSVEVSAVAGAPALGEPLSARASVSARSNAPELPDAEGAFDETIIGSRRRTSWLLTPPLGAPIAITSDVLIVGRRPSTNAHSAHAQRVAVTDETRTISKTHARLQLDGDRWLITDLDSTNGVVLIRADGSEVELISGRPEVATETFLLGDAELRLTRAPGA